MDPEIKYFPILIIYHLYYIHIYKGIREIYFSAIIYNL